jgi:hypothetical protein
MSQNHRRAAPVIDPTKKSSLFEVPCIHNAGGPGQLRARRNLVSRSVPVVIEVDETAGTVDEIILIASSGLVHYSIKRNSRSAMLCKRRQQFPTFSPPRRARFSKSP